MPVLSGITFRPDLSPRLIIVDAPADTLNLQDLHDTVAAWQDEPPNHDYDVMIQSEGKNDIGGGVEVGITVKLLNAQVMFEARVAVISNGTITTGDPNGVLLTDAAGDFLSTVTRGDILLNVTDGSKGTVLNVMSNTQLQLDRLVGGSDNRFDSSDAYEIFDVITCTISGGNLTAVDDLGATLPETLPSFGTQVKVAKSSSSTLVSTAGLAPTQQQIRDALKLSPSAGVPAADSVDEQLGTLQTTIDSAGARVFMNVAYAESLNVLRISVFLERSGSAVVPTAVMIVWYDEDSTVLFILTENEALPGQDPDAQGNYVFELSQPLTDDVTYAVDVTLTDAIGPVTRREQVTTVKGS
jgi:hypothetical protein